jgi:hypothetical protein
MDDQGLLCDMVCRQFPGWAVELFALVLVLARTFYVSWRTRQLTADKVSLQAKVETLSLRPPGALTLQLAPHTGLQNFLPVTLVPTPLDAASSGKPSVATSTASNPPPSDPDHFEPVDD